MSEQIKPNGFYVLVEMVEVKNVSAGGIHLGDVRREQDAADIGFIRGIGNTAFFKFPGCDPSEYPPSHSFYSMSPAQIWGVEIGDKVEYRRYEGKGSAVKGYEKFRYIPDTQIIGKVL